MRSQRHNCTNRYQQKVRSVVYTSVGGTLRGYTVVVPTDASLAATDYEVAIGQFQILNQNSANATNEPLKANASTLSRADIIVFQ